ncbi:hypothetical protein HNQ39_005960 [Armatimonas rosea]|uniref:Uncharacterized protein n=1 Tax=Armatimonas rosea TaxID=685828 RepID=A0A7W9SX89_ARMRO|nr:hypothetical protein [Armatimonas rosea]
MGALSEAGRLNPLIRTILDTKSPSASEHGGEALVRVFKA